MRPFTVDDIIKMLKQHRAASRPAKHRSCKLVVMLAIVVLITLYNDICSVLSACVHEGSVDEGFNYGDALEKCILFFECQRSGKLPDSQRASWRGDSGMTDGQSVGVDLIGGYYDAGDNVKFGLPMAFTATLLSWSVTDYRDELESSGQLQHAEDAIRWATDYLLKAITGPTELWVQVGDADADHACWERPEDMDTSRTSYKIDEDNPGTEPAAETAAALAAASKVFEQTDSDYSTRLREQARAMFDFADRYQASYGAACPYYCFFTGYVDELLWAAAWLYAATGEQFYLDYVVDNSSFSIPAPIFTWDDKYAGVQILLTRYYLEGNEDLHTYKDHADAFVCAVLPLSPLKAVEFTPGGLLFIQDDNNIQFVTTSAFLLANYADSLSRYGLQVPCQDKYFGSRDLESFAKSQVDYLLGGNPLGISYMVGYSNYYPRQSHHRAASIVSSKDDPYKIACSEGYRDWYVKDEANPNVLTGAILGPNSSDQFWDRREDFQHLESPTYVNAPFVGLLAKINHMF